MIKKIIAFTLSEILLVVAIVAVVATLTVPNLKKSQDRSELVARAKAAMAKIDASIHQVDIVNALNGHTTNVERSESLLQEMANTLKLSAFCGEQAETLCFTKQVIDPTGTVGRASVPGEGESWSGKPIGSGDCATATINDGSAFAICITNYPSVPAASNDFGINDYYGYVLVDVDGPTAGSNTRGQDIYVFVISNDGLVLPQQGGKEAQEGYEDAVFENVNNM